MSKQTQPFNLIIFIFFIFYHMLQITKQACIQSCTSCSPNMSCLQCSSNLKGCLPCRPSCKTCVSEYSQCTSCANSYYMNNTNMKCIPCLAQYCQTCSQLTPEVCTSCMTGYYLISSTGTCENCGLYPNAATCRQNMILSCQLGYYVSGGQKCINCGSNCLKCTSPTYCTTCMDGYFGSSCTACHSSCLTCIRSNACLTCKVGTFINSSSLCSACQYSNNYCTACDSTGKCIKCLLNYYLDSNKICMPVLQQQLIFGCTQYAVIVSGSSVAIICKVCQQGYFLTTSGMSCIQCSILCGNCTGLYSSSSCMGCQSDFAVTISPGFCGYAPNSLNKNSYKNIYLSQWNFPSNFIDLGTNVAIVNQNCPSWKLSTISRVQIGFVSGYSISYKIKITFSVRNLDSLSNLNYSLIFNNFTIAQSSLQLNSTIQKSTLCSQRSPTSLNSQYTQIISSILPSFISAQQLDPLLKLPNNSNYFQIEALSPNLYLKISQIVISYHSCHQSCTLCSNDVQCVLCKDSNMLLQQQQCVDVCGQFYYQLGNKCVDSCPVGMFQNMFTKFWSCSKCPSQCAMCDSSDSCYACNSGYYLYGSTCVTTCPIQHFANPTTLHCQPCSPPCLTCNSSTICLSCSYNFLFNNSCISSSNCPIGYFPNIPTMSCDKCQSPCLTCTSSNFCTKCESNSSYLYKGKCNIDCPIGYIKNISSIACDKCSPQCQICKNTTDNCIRCVNGFLLDGRCLNNCPDGLFQNYTDMICTICAYPCSTCRTNQHTCKTCVKGYILHQQFNLCILQNACLTMVGSFLSNRNITINSSNATNMSTTANIKYCTICPLQCFSCISSTKCQYCKSPYYLLNLTCLVSCPYSYYNNKKQQICSECSPNCSTCQNEPNYCTSCPINMKLSANNTCQYGCLYTNQLYNSCQKCMQPCYSCKNVVTMCTFCIDGYFLYASNYECLQKCYDGYYQQRVSRLCVRCDPLCLTCTNNSKQCTSCPGSTYLFIHNNIDKSGECLKTCLSSYFPSILSASYQICQKCQQPCLQCFLNSTNCKSCKSGILNTNQCILQCPITKYQNIINSTCLGCQVSCLSCFGASNKQCYSCKIGYFYMQQQNACVSVCPIGYIGINFEVESNSRCQPCQFPCVSCVNNTTTCTSCWSNNNTYPYLLYQNKCIRKCPVATYQSNNYCIACQPPCLQCISSNICLTCIPIKYYLNNQCLSQCPPTYFSENSSLICHNCQYPCKTCTSQTSCLSCVDGIRIGNACMISDQCPIGKYVQYKQTNGVCQNCNKQCLICKQVKDRCVLCSNNSLVLFDHQCIEECMLGYYQSVELTNLGVIGYSLINIRICVGCPFQCIACNSQTQCIMCIKGYKYLQGKCILVCPPQYYYNNSNEITGINFGGQCILCSHNCKTCVNSAQNCLSCKQGLFYYRYNCYQSCQIGKYAQIYSPNNQYNNNNTVAYTGICRQCIFPCKQCNNSQACIHCYSGYYLYKGMCIEVCKKPNVILQIDNDYTCIQKCPVSHKFLLDQYNTYKCSQVCTYPYILSADSLTCLTECSDGQFINQNLQCQKIDNKAEITEVKVNAYVDLRYKIKLYVAFNQPIAYQQFGTYIEQLILINLHTNVLFVNNSLQTNKKYGISRLLTHRNLQANQPSKSIQFTVIQLTANYFVLQLNPSSFYTSNSYQFSTKQSNSQSTNYITLQFKNNTNLLLRNKISTIPIQNPKHYCKIPTYQSYPIQFQFYITSYFTVFGQVFVVFIIIIAAILIGFNWLAKIYHCLHFCQFLFLLAVLDIQYPPNLWLFLQGFRNSHFYFIGNWFTLQQNLHKVTESSDKIQAIFVDSNFIRICGHIFCLLFICLFVWLMLFLLKFIQKLQNKMPNFLDFLLILSKLAQNKLKIIKWSHIHDFMIASATILIFGFFVQMYDYNILSSLQILGILTSFIVIIGLIVYFVYMGYRIYKIVKLSTNNPQKYCQKNFITRSNLRSITQGITHPKYLYMNYWRICKIIFIGGCIGIFNQSSMLCTSSLMVVLLISALLYLITKPYPDTLQNILLGCADIFAVLALFFISLIHFQTIDKMNHIDNIGYLTIKWRLGWAGIIMIIIASSLLLAELLVNIVKGNIAPLKLSAEDRKKVTLPLLAVPRVIEATPKKQLDAWQIEQEQQQSPFGFQFEIKNA